MTSPDAHAGFVPPVGAYVVIFTSQLRQGVKGYDDVATRMLALAQKQSGFLGFEASRDASGLGITLSYWESEVAIRAWREHPEHQIAQRLGRTDFYVWHKTVVARVER